MKVERDLRARVHASSAGLPNGPEGFRSLLDPPAGCRSALRLHPTSGSCWFRDEPAGLCSIHRAFGEESLPSACRHFPRVCVLEPDTVSISLSHYCPTAVGLLFHEGDDFRVVGDPPAFPSSWPFEGLDVGPAHPPFLRPGVLLGFDGLRAFEEEAIRVLARRGVWKAVLQIEQATDTILEWTPAAGSLVDLIRGAFRGNPETAPAARRTDPSPTLTASIPEGTSPKPLLPAYRAAPPEIPATVDLPLRRYLAARLVAAWIMFQGEGLTSVARYLRLCLNTVLLFEADGRRIPAGADPWKEAVRSSDLWILHHCDPELLARNLG